MSRLTSLSVTLVMYAGWGSIGLPTAAQQMDLSQTVAAPAFVAVSVADLDSSVAWYVRVLGVNPVRAVGGGEVTDRAVVLRGGQLVVELIDFAASRSRGELLGADAHTYAVQGLVKAGVFVHGIDAWRERLDALGVRVEHIVLDSTLDARTFVFRDRDGNRIQIFERCEGVCRDARSQR